MRVRSFSANAEGAFCNACGVVVQEFESKIFLVLRSRELDGEGKVPGTCMRKGIG
mgnify:CR=1 FL=1